MAALKYWVWLTAMPELTNRSTLLLLEHFSSPEDIYYADEGAILATGLGRDQAACLADKSLDRAERILADCARKDIFLVTMDDATYPHRLRNIFDAPALLYGKGAMPLFDDEVAVAVVGTRSATPYGIKTAEELGYTLSMEHALVVSGMAKGIDGASHRGALRSGGFTAAVLGGGVDVVYPQSNRDLYEDIAATGVLLSEYPPGTRPEGWHFPVRNRIISGLSLCTLVVEAPARSGALITANTALEQGRDVFAVPGAIDAPNSLGCNRLIQSGAGLVTCAWDILGEYVDQYPHKLRRQRKTMPELPLGGAAEVVPDTLNASEAEEDQTDDNPPPELPVITPEQLEQLTDDQLRILRVLNCQGPTLSDEAAEQTELPIYRVLSALTVLEIDGFVRQSGARCFVRTVKLSQEE